MSRRLQLAGIVLAFASAANANTDPCTVRGCPVQFEFASTSAARSYGLLITAPETGCRRVRFRVEEMGTFLGQTPPLAPGELAVVRIGRGYPEGQNKVTIASVGCDTSPAGTRRVVLAKIAPDHGWRASGH